MCIRDRFAPISWDEAIGEIGDRWRRIIAEYGAEAILPYSYSGTLGLVQLAVSNGRFWNRLGTSQLERAICGDAAQYAVERTLGARWAVPYADTAHSRAILIWGHNPASTAPHFMPYLKDAQRRGCVVAVSYTHLRVRKYFLTRCSRRFSRLRLNIVGM